MSKQECLVRKGDVVNVKCHIWLDGSRVEESESALNKKYYIADGTIWGTSVVSRDEFCEFATRSLKVSRVHELTDEERVAVFKKTKKLGPETETREHCVSRIPSRDIDGTRMCVVDEPVEICEGVWHVVIGLLDSVEEIGLPSLRVNFFLAHDGASIEHLDPMKVVSEYSVFVAPTRGVPLFGPWSDCQKKQKPDKLEPGNVVSGAELRFYHSGANRKAEYLVTKIWPIVVHECVCSHDSFDCPDSCFMDITIGYKVDFVRVHFDKCGDIIEHKEKLEGVYITTRSRETSLCQSLCIGGNTQKGYVF